MANTHNLFNSPMSSSFPGPLQHWEDISGLTKQQAALARLELEPDMQS